MIETRPLDPGSRLPLVVERRADDAGADGAQALLAWIRDNEAHLDAQLLDRGAVLFRGFGIASPGAFARLTRAVAPRLLEAREENVPRTRLSAGIYTSTEYPAEYELSLHSEYSYSHRWPAQLYFCCVAPAREGGETPIADTREVLRSLDADVVAEFERKQLTYTRNLHDGSGFGLSWQQAFQTTSRAEVEDQCRERRIDLTWTASGARLEQTLEATIRHPRTGERVWFNQAPQFHPSDYPLEIYRSLMAVYGAESELPQNVRFGDGTPIDPAALAHVRETMRRRAVAFPWQKGDLLIIDNALVAHGRMPFAGPRKVLVAMSEA